MPFDDVPLELDPPLGLGFERAPELPLTVRPDGDDDGVTGLGLGFVLPPEPRVSLLGMIISFH